MPKYTEYANEKTTPNRKARKGLRTKTFVDNYNAARKARKARKAELEARLAAQEETTEE